MKRNIAIVATLIAVAFSTSIAGAQTRDEQVLQDRQLLSKNDNWYYDDLDAGALEAAKQNKPLMVVLRCIP